MLFIKDSAGRSYFFYLNHHLTLYKSLMESYINYTSIISNYGVSHKSLRLSEPQTRTVAKQIAEACGMVRGRASTSTFPGAELPSDQAHCLHLALLLLLKNGRFWLQHMSSLSTPSLPSLHNLQSCQQEPVPLRSRQWPRPPDRIYPSIGNPSEDTLLPVCTL